MNAEATRRHLVIFARRPRLGVGKRRLAADVGDLAALRFSRAALGALRRRLGRDPRWTTWLAVSPDRSADWDATPKLLPQGAGDLGQRLARVLTRLPAGPAVIIGSDTPGVRRAEIAAAFDALGRSDAVFGPACDGGYWLIGLRRRARLPFDNVRWSSRFALLDTVRNLKGRSVSWLDLREDVDDGASLARVDPRDLAPW
jgi:uncharacterized protein